MPCKGASPMGKAMKAMKAMKSGVKKKVKMKALKKGTALEKGQKAF